MAGTSPAMTTARLMFLSSSAFLEIPFLSDLLFHVRRERVDLGEFIHPAIGPAGVDQHAVGGVAARRALVRRDRGIGRRSPYVFDEINAFARIAAGRDSPDHVAQIGDVHVV